MPFTVEEFRDLVHILEQRPEWRAELRRLVLTDELLSLPEQVASLRTETERHLQELTEAQARTTAQIADLTRTMQALADDVGELKGKSLEADYRTKGPAYFSRLLRRVHVLSADELTALIENAVDRGALTAAQAQEIYETDLIVRGKRWEDGTEAHLVVEISWGVGPRDVERVVRRAALLGHIGLTVIPVVAGRRITAEAARMAHSQQVWQLRDGHAVSPESVDPSS